MCAFLLLRDVEGLPVLEDFCNKDKKNLEMVQWLMWPMIGVLQEGSIQLYLTYRRKWYTRRGDGEAERARLALLPGLAVRGRRACPAIPTTWRDEEEEDEGEEVKEKTKHCEGCACPENVGLPAGEDDSP